MEIRQAVTRDFERVAEIYAVARAFMVKTGNPTQWAGGYPSDAIIRADIQNGSLYVLEGCGQLHGVFAFFPEGDPDYDAIPSFGEKGVPYGAIHRVASAGTAKGVLAAIVAFCLARRPCLKIDTHKDNTVMQRALEKQGFVSFGTFKIPNVGERILYQLSKESTK